MQKPNFQYYEFIRPAFADTTQHILLRAWRRTGKTFWAVQWINEMLMRHPNTRGLWVDTVQANLWKYIDRYFKPILWPDFWKTIKADNQKYILTYMNGSILDMWSAERPENLEWFEYDFYVLNEAGIILKKVGLWDNTLQPMLKNARGKIIGTAKGKTHNGEPSKYFQLSELCKTEPNFKEYHYTAYDSPEWTPEQLEQIKSQVPSYIWKQEYMSEFVDIYENSILAPDDIRYYDEVSLDDFDELFMHADTTHTWKQTSDYFCLTVLGKNKKDKNFYMIDFILKKCDVEVQARESITMYSKYKNKVKKFTYDEKSNNWFGFWIKKLAKEEYDLSLPIEELKYPSDKVSHFTPHVPHFKANRMYFPRNNPQIHTAIDQLLAFPTKWVHDDFVDGISGVMDNFATENKWFYVFDI